MKMMNINQNYNTSDLFKKLKILTLKELYNKASIIIKKTLKRIMSETQGMKGFIF